MHDAHDVRRPRPGGPGGRRPGRAAWSQLATVFWPLPRLSSWLLLLAFVSWDATLGRFSTASRASVGAAIAACVVAALVAGRRRQHKSSWTWARDGVAAVWADVTGRGRGRALAPVRVGVAAWTLLVAATIGWDLFSFSEQLHSLPTLSRLFGDVTRHPWGRGVVLAAWVALGIYLAVGWRRPRRGTGRAECPDQARPSASPPGTGAP